MTADPSIDAGLPIRLLHDRVLVRVEGPEGERRYTKLTVGEKMRLQFDSMVSDTKKNVKRAAAATGFGAKAK